MDYPFTYCLNPRKVHNPYIGEDLVVPCGKCTACSMNKSFRYAFQCDCEAKVSKYVYFITLTYANTYIPRMRAYEIFKTPSEFGRKYDLFDVTSPRSRYDTSLNYLGFADYSPDLYRQLVKKCRLFGDIPYLRKRDLQLFIKNLRTFIPEYEIRYFASGEYGPDTFRPHFHILLYCNYPELCTPSDYCTLSEFPEWTWPKRKKRFPCATDRLTLLEYYVRSAWQYGIVDCELITDGTASSYVASYVNGSQSLPPFLEIPATRCFSVHSRFLGRALFRKELVQVLSTPAADFVKGSVFLGTKSRDYTLRYENFRYFYPKCKGYASSDSSRRLLLYRSYDTARAYFGSDCFCLELSRRLLDVLYMKWFLSSPDNEHRLGLTFNLLYPRSIIALADALYPFSRLPLHDVLTNEDWEKILFNIYNQILVSRTFCENFRILKVSPEWYLSRIEDFYSCLDYMHLTDFFEAQSKYFDCDYADEGDVVYFYNNSDYDFDNFKNSFSYRAFKANIKSLSQQFIKHKLQNDKNKLFVVEEKL